MQDSVQRSDFLVIGSGIAGLIYALDVAEYGTVTVITKSNPTEGNTRYAQGGIASVTSPADSFESHIQDTINVGAGICHEDVVRRVITEGPKRIAQLVELGVHFDRITETGEFELGQEGGHTTRRILHSRDQTGAEIERGVLERASAHPNINILPHHVAVDLITKDIPSGGTEIVGVYALEKDSRRIKTYVARATMLAAGGVGKVYLYTSNPDVATGDGIAMAFRAGAQIANMEFIQFHPTCLFHPNAKSFLITEAMRGEGAKLLTPAGEPFMHLYDERGELAPRDIVARAIDDQMKRSGLDYVLLDISHRKPEFVRERFPHVYNQTKQFGFDITTGPIPVVPAAHYCCGGVSSDIFGRSVDLKRLYVAGENACTGLHGANRLASNSLLEALVFGHIAAEDTIRRLSEFPPPADPQTWDYLDTIQSPEEVLVSHTWDEVRRIMWNLVGIVRSDKRLSSAAKRIQLIEEEVRDYYWKFHVTSDLVELRNIVTVAQVIIASAQKRRESRGLHYNVDCPKRDDKNWSRDTIIAKLSGE